MNTRNMLSWSDVPGSQLATSSSLNRKLFKGISVNKSELIDAIAAAADLPKASAGRALDAVVDSITDALTKGDQVSLVGFGTFSVAKRAARQGRNPQTGKMIKIAAKKVAKFKAGSKLADAVKK